MRSILDLDRLRRVLDALARACSRPGTVYVTGGATALLWGWRTATVDLDLKLDPEPRGVFAAIARIKEDLKLSRGLERDMADVRAMLELQRVSCSALHAGLEQMRPRLERFPRVSPADLESRLAEVCPAGEDSP